MSGIGRAGESVAAEADVADTFHQGFQHSNLGGADSNTSDEKLSDEKKAHAVEEDYDDLGDVPEGCTIPTEEVSFRKREKAGILTLFPRLPQIAHLLAFESFTILSNFIFSKRKRALCEEYQLLYHTPRS